MDLDVNGPNPEADPRRVTRWVGFTALGFLALNAVLLVTDGINPLTYTASLLVALLLVSVTARSAQRALAAADARSAELDAAVGRLERTSVSKAHVDNVLAAVRDMIVVTDPRGVVTDVNPAAVDQLGLPRASLVGRPMRELLVEGSLLDASVVTAASATARRGDGRTLPVLASRGRLPARTGQIDGFVWALSDLSVQHAAVEAARRAHDQAESANLAKSQFLANMSHELRTPLNAIIGYSELLAEELTRPEQHGDLNRIRGAGRHLLGLINGILDLSKVEAGKMQLDLTDLDPGALIREACETVRPTVRPGVTLTVAASDLGRPVRLDPVKTRQILLNLLSNAAKFTEHGEIRVDAERWPRDGMPWLRISVSDTGIGLSAEQVARVFEPFAQADSETTRTYGGTGLGLSITRAFTRMMGGEIHVESQLGRGTVFTVELPVGVMEHVRTPGGRVRRAVPQPAGTGEQLVLYIDDDPSALELVQRLLTSPGRRVVATPEPEEGLSWARSLRPHLVLLDVQMPRISGWNVLAQLRAEPSLAALRVVVLTAEGEEPVARALGADRLIRKPIERQRLLEIVDGLLGEAT